MDQFSEEEMDSGFHGSAKSAHRSLHGLCLETFLDHVGDYFPEDKGLKRHHRNISKGRESWPRGEEGREGRVKKSPSPEGTLYTRHGL